MADRKTDRPDGGKLAEMAASGYSFSQLAAKFNITTGTVAGAIRHYKQSNPDSKLFEVNFGKPLSLVGNAIIAGDIHVPTTNYEFAKRITAVAKYYGIKILILAGDIYNFDLFSKYPRQTVMTSWAQERDAGRHLFQMFQEYFDEIYVIMGNHDRRMIKWADGHLDETDVFGLITTSPKVHVSNFGYCSIKSGGENWLVTHSSEYSVNQLTVADQLAQKYKSNVITHHEHHVAKGRDRYKSFTIINNGGLFAQEKMVYTQLDTSKKPNMANGFTALVNGCGHLYTPYPSFTDWTHIDQFKYDS
jgi:predicted phosphodiesterase